MARAGQAARCALGVEGIKADDGEGYYFPPDVRFADGRSGAEAGLGATGLLYRRSMQRALDEVHPGERRAVRPPGLDRPAGASASPGAATRRRTSGRCATLVAATLTAAACGFSNWSHDVGGYLGERLVARCPKELLLRWVQFGCFTPLMQAHGRFAQEAWTYDARDARRSTATYVLLHERLVPYVRAAAATAARCGLPIVRPLLLTDPADARGWALADAVRLRPGAVGRAGARGGRARARGRRCRAATGSTSGRRAPRSRRRRAAGARAARTGSRSGCAAARSIVTYPAEHVAAGLGDTPERERPLEATLWGEPPLRPRRRAPRRRHPHPLARRRLERRTGPGGLVQAQSGERRNSMADEQAQQGNGGGVATARDTLSVTDNRTGESYELEITDGTVKAMDFRQIKVVRGRLRPDDLRPGVHEHGVLPQLDHLHRRRRRHPRVPRLPDRAALRALHLPRGRLPAHPRRAADPRRSSTSGSTRSRSTPTSTRTSRSSSRASATTPTRWGCCSPRVGALSTFYPDAKHIDDDDERHMAAVRLIAKVPTLAAFAYRHNLGCPTSIRTTTCPTPATSSR